MAHRGWHTDTLSGLENTLRAFARAASEGYSYVETDARVTADGAVMLHHDPFLGRTTGANALISDLTLAEVRTLLVGGREPVPTLTEALAALPRTRFNIDLKVEAAVCPVLADLDRADAWDRVCLASFSEPRLARLRRTAGPRLFTSLGPRSVAALRARSVLPVPLPGRGLPRGDVVQVPPGAGLVRLVDRRLLAQAHRSGREVHVWTINDADQMHRLLDLGVDGIVTDAPGVLRDVLRRRGSWRPGL